MEDEEDDGEVVIHPARQDLMRETALKIKEARAEAKAANDARDAAIRGAGGRPEASGGLDEGAPGGAGRCRSGTSPWSVALRGQHQPEEGKSGAQEEARGSARGRAQLAADAHNLRQSLDVFKRIKSELEAKIVQLEGAALQARHATPKKEPMGKEPAAWAV